jgi:hypothetical protein
MGYGSLVTPDSTPKTKMSNNTPIRVYPCGVEGDNEFGTTRQNHRIPFWYVCPTSAMSYKTGWQNGYRIIGARLIELSPTIWRILLVFVVIALKVGIGVVITLPSVMRPAVIRAIPFMLILTGAVPFAGPIVPAVDKFDKSNLALGCHAQ